jgi:hypothetical protein
VYLDTGSTIMESEHGTSKVYTIFAMLSPELDAFTCLKMNTFSWSDEDSTGRGFLV